MPATKSLPEDPSLLGYVLLRVWHDILRHRTIDAAAALTFWSTLAVFPIALAVVSGVAVFQGGEEAVAEILAVVRPVVRPSTLDVLRGPLEQLLSISSPGVAFGIGLALTLWSLSAYATAFGRAMNTVYDVEEGRRIWTFRGTMMVVTLALMAAFGIMAVILLVTPTLAESVAGAWGFGRPWTTLWNVLKWPVLAALAVLVVAMLYFFTPNVRPPRLRWVSYGAGLALVVWAICTLLFAVYVQTFSNYDRFYGWLGGALAVLLYSYISNFVLVVGGELDSEVLRARQLRRGVQAEDVIPLPVRSVERDHILARNSAWDSRVGRRIREQALREHGGQQAPDELEKLHLVRDHLAHRARGTTGTGPASAGTSGAGAPQEP